MKFLSLSIRNIIGPISPPPGSSGLNAVDPAIGLSNLLVTAIRLVLIGGGVAAFIYLLWGAINLINSQGEKELLVKAQEKMVNAVVGLLLIVVSLTLFTIITGDILGIIKKVGGGFEFIIPTF